jgi:hypothetical protein
MCFIYFAKKINIYYRDDNKFTKADMCLTYIFIFSMIFIFIFYTRQYYIVVKYDLDNCENYNTENSCLKTEMTIIFVPYIGIIYSFFQVLYKTTDIIAFITNCICCCVPIIHEIYTPDIEETTIELSDIHSRVIYDNISGNNIIT